MLILDLAHHYKETENVNLLNETERKKFFATVLKKFNINAKSSQPGRYYSTEDVCAGNPTKITDLTKLKIIDMKNTASKPNNLSVVSRHFNIDN